MEDLGPLMSVLNYTFKNPNLLITACTHKSFGEGAFLENNERLEFLGDAVLDLAVSYLLCKLMPEASEGYLTQARAFLVNDENLTQVAQRLGLQKYIRKSAGVNLDEKKNASVLAGCFEAILGSIFTEGGLQPVYELVDLVFHDQIQIGRTGFFQQSFKAVLQIVAQDCGKKVTYETTRNGGFDHAPIFQSQMSINGLLLSVGYGQSKKKAEEEAALNYLEQMGYLDEITEIKNGI